MTSSLFSLIFPPPFLCLYKFLAPVDSDLFENIPSKISANVIQINDTCYHFFHWHTQMVRSVLEGTGEYVSSLIEDSVEQEYVDWSQADNESADYLGTFVRFRTDQRYSCGATYVSKVHAKFGIPVYLYKMTQIPSK